MNWEPSAGTEAISGWITQGTWFALALAVAVLVGCAVLWAMGSLSANPAVASRARTGIAVALAAALLLGAGATLLNWTADTQAPAFAGDSAEYAIADTPDIPGAWTPRDLSQAWTARINRVRAADGLPPYRTDPALTAKARSCAESRAGLGGTCPVNTLGCFEDRGMVFGAWEYGPAELDRLDGVPSEGFVRDPNPWGGESLPVALDPSPDMWSAWVALVDHANHRAVLVAMFENAAGLAVWNKCVRG